jgi:hypothetical protein
MSASNSAGPKEEWIDPRPKLPRAGCKVIVKCSDGKEREAVLANTWEGPQWKHWLGGAWSMACPEIVAWRYAP